MTIGKWAGGIIGGLAIAWGLYAGLVRPTTKPNPLTTQSATEIINHNYHYPRVTFGCMNVKAMREKQAEK